MKPLGIKAYGSIPHLPGSRRGPADKGLTEEQASILTDTCRRGDRVIVTEKLDGSNTAVAKIEGQIIPLVRAGYRAASSRYKQHHLFEDWVMRQHSLFFALLEEGERACGEWLAQAHGTRYELSGRSPWTVFDLMKVQIRVPWDVLCDRVEGAGLTTVPTLHVGDALPLHLAMDKLGMGHYGTLDPPEGVVYRVENAKGVDFLGKYVRPELEPGRYFPENRNGEVLWNWYPE